MSQDAHSGLSANAHQVLCCSSRSSMGWWLVVVWLAAVLLPSFAQVFLTTVSSTHSGSEVSLAGQLLGSTDGLVATISSLICVFLLALFGRPAIWLALHFPFLLWLPIEMYYQWRYLEPTSAHIISILRESNVDEAAGYLGVWLWPALIAGMLWVLLVTGSVVVARGATPWPPPTRRWAVISLGGLIIVFVVNIHLATVEALPAKAESSSDACIRGHCVGHVGFMLLAQSYPWGLPVRFLEYSQQQKTLAERADALGNEVRTLPRLAGLQDEREVFVLVLGESARADRFQVLGYPRATTPNLAKRGNLVAFTDAVTATVATRTSVPILLSDSRVEDLAEFELKSSWIPTFQESGFHVAWLSTQMPVGTHDTTIGIYAALADEVRFVNPGNYRARGAVDGALLEPLQSVLLAGHQKLMVVLHTLGSHAPYARRYPPEFEHFTPSLGDTKRWQIVDGDSLALIDNAYDNSIRYTDWFLDAVIEQIDDAEQQAALWYVADHGVTLLSDGCKNEGNGFLSRENLHIPAFFWFNSAYKSGPLSVIAEQIVNARNRPVYTGTFSETLLGTFGFVLPDAEQSNSWIGKNLARTKRLVTVDGKALHDYDAHFSETACVDRN